MGWTRELWIESLGMPAVIPPPEEEKDVKTAIGAARAKAARKEMLYTFATTRPSTAVANQDVDNDLSFSGALQQVVDTSQHLRLAQISSLRFEVIEDFGGALSSLSYRCRRRSHQRRLALTGGIHAPGTQRSTCPCSPTGDRRKLHWVGRCAAQERRRGALTERNVRKWPDSDERTRSGRSPIASPEHQGATPTSEGTLHL